MSRTTARPRKATLISAVLRESTTGSKSLRVDRDAGIIYGVKVLGKSSPNTHGVRGVEGTDYSPEAMKRALPLYEGRKVNVDHLPRDGKARDYSAYDRLGKLVNVRLQDGEPYADLHILKAHRMAEVMFEAAERMPDAFGLSHNAYGKGEIRGKRYVITEIPEVKNVDVVADAGTTRSLSESRREKPMKTLKSVLESLKVSKKAIKAIQEMEGMKGCMSSTPEDAMPEYAEEPEDESFETHLGRCIVAILNDEELSPEDKKKKVLAAVKLVGDDSEEKPTGESDDEDVVVAGKKKEGAGERDGKAEESDDDGKEEEEKGEEAEKKQAAKESRDMKSEIEQLKRKDAVRTLCESEKFQPSPLQLKALMGFDTDKERKAFITESRGQHARPTAPRSTSYSAPAGGNGHTDSKSYASSLLR